MKQTFGIGDFVEIIGGEWDGGRGTVRTVYDDGYKIYLGPEDGEVKVYPPITTRLPLADAEIKTPGISLKRLARWEKQSHFAEPFGIKLERDTDTCKTWLQNYTTKQGDINRQYSSQKLRYWISKWSSRSVSCTGVIRAAKELGYDCERVSRNTYFNMAFPPQGTQKYREAFPDKRG